MTIPLSTLVHTVDAPRRTDANLLDSVAESGMAILVKNRNLGVEGDRLVMVPGPAIPTNLLTWSTMSFLGSLDGTPIVALDLTATTADLDPDGMPRGEPGLIDLVRHDFESLRRIGHLLPETERGLGTVASALTAWRATTRHCTSCGSALEIIAAGWEAQCSGCQMIHYPRHDPSVIMSIRDRRDRILLGHAANWPDGRYSCLAGFVEAGESLENAVAREAYEEASVRITSCEYVGSQPWPFPRSLMMAFRAWTDATDEDIEVDGVEVTEARFFDRDTFASLVASGEVSIPMETSAGRFLIEDWYGRPIATP